MRPFSNEWMLILISVGLRGFIHSHGVVIYKLSHIQTESGGFTWTSYV